MHRTGEAPPRHPKRIAITGAAGGLGRCVTRMLAGALGPDVEIVAMDRRRLRAPERVETHLSDVREPGLWKLLRGCDSVVHLAFVTTGDDARDVNVGGTENVVRACARAGVRQVVYASSIAVYGFHPENRGRVLDESAPLRGDRDLAYARDKAAAERVLDRLEAELAPLRIARLRPSYFLGPRSVEVAWLSALPGAFPHVASPHPFHATAERDVAAAFVLALQEGALGAFNVATRDPLPLAAWARCLGRLAVPVPPEMARLWSPWGRLLDLDPGWLSVPYRHPLVVSSDKARRLLGWRPRYATTAAALRAAVSGPGARSPWAWDRASA